jgi:hypothetical protein
LSLRLLLSVAVTGPGLRIRLLGSATLVEVILEIAQRMAQSVTDGRDEGNSAEYASTACARRRWATELELSRLV